MSLRPLRLLALAIPAAIAAPLVAPAPASAASAPATITTVIDGDTVRTSSGATVRLIGIDAPESGQCGAAQATALMKRYVLNQRVTLTTGPTNRDRYGRYLRYVNRGTFDAGKAMLTSGWAYSRYDSRDGYGAHPRQASYIVTDRAHPFPSSCPMWYPSCVAVRMAGKAPLYRNQPGYRSALDSDRDGIACE
jgi:endonuclease YncB( thermonuclease family)